MRCSVFTSKMPMSLPCVIDLIAAVSISWRAPESASGSFQHPANSSLADNIGRPVHSMLFNAFWLALNPVTVGRVAFNAL